MVKKIDQQGFDEALMTVGKPIVVDFATEWCPYCKKLKPVLDEIAAEYGDKVDVYYVDTDEEEALSERYDVMTVPSVFVFLNGEEIGSVVNPRSKESILNLISN